MIVRLLIRKSEIFIEKVMLSLDIISIMGNKKHGLWIKALSSVTESVVTSYVFLGKFQGLHELFSLFSKEEDNSLTGFLSLKLEEIVFMEDH